MPDQRIQSIVGNMLASHNGIGIPRAPQAEEAIKAMLEPVVQHINALSQGMIRVVDGQQNIGMALDVTRLTLYTLVGILIDKGIMTKEEWDEKYQTGVVDKIKKMQEEFENHMKAVQTAQQAQPQEEEPINSDVVLPSERGEVIKFPG